ncbi:MAG: SDR family oxidoreductase [Myxococcales bacterium]|nr:SDR family oxidoreductase [Myxococcales bacterium]
MSKRFARQAVWITGGSSGIGKALALEFAKQGADVAVSGRRQDRLDEVAAQIEALGVKALAVPCEVSDTAQIEAAVERVVECFGKIDVCVANAGFGVAGTIEKLTEEEWRRQLDVNVIGLVMTVKHALPELRKTKGRIALVGSVSAMLCVPTMGAYSASKFAVRAIGQTLSLELHGSGVSCTTIHPGFVESEIAQVDNRGVFKAERKDDRPAQLMWPADRAARVMAEAIAKRKREYTFTMHGKVGAWLGRHVPGAVHFATTRFAKGMIPEDRKR